MLILPTDPEVVSRIITSLKSNKSSGHDGFSSKFMNTLKPALYKPISILINKPLEPGNNPANIKIVKITPIYKSKEKN
ncbi:hypothetical protein LSH36_1566g00002 [Paralvinella palmiformis]|uniref:Reverse transcriptase n=1 Tax=Paralvinella palmiformis TaxID=53620 RepID=A0AAD9IS70_9ANNE|nr:hypothetical protein LSH36_1566g00002 [Paralvinella palmiformis]